MFDLDTCKKKKSADILDIMTVSMRCLMSVVEKITNATAKTQIMLVF